MNQKQRACLCAVAALCVYLSGCKNLPKESENSEPSQNGADSGILSSEMDAYAAQTITFPVSDSGKTEYNAAIYEITPFTLTFVLPSDWTVEEAEIPKEDAFPLHYLNYSVWSIMDILNDTGDCVGSVGYNVYELYEGAEDNPQAIYNQIALGNGYRFDVTEAYTPVITTDNSCTAITNVLYSAAFMEGWGQERAEKVNRGILSYDKNRLVYIAAEFDSDRISEEQLRAIAESINFSTPE